MTSLTIAATVTDAAGREASASVTVDVLAGPEAARFTWFSPAQDEET